MLLLVGWSWLQLVIHARRLVAPCADAPPPPPPFVMLLMTIIRFYNYTVANGGFTEYNSRTYYSHRQQQPWVIMLHAALARCCPH